MYYNLNKILNKKDLNKKEPAIYMVSSNRSAGKTFAVLKYFLEEFKKNNNNQCGFIYRHKYELSSVGEIFKDVLKLNPELGLDVDTKSYAGGLFYEITLDSVTLGYAWAMSNPDALKKYSPVFSLVKHILFDEFQTETGKYLPQEIKKFQSLYQTIARGGGEQSRDVKVFMLANNVSIMNPYYVAFGIHKRLKLDTKFLRGNGWVLETAFNKSASESIKNNAFFSAFEESSYMQYSVENKYLIDSEVFVERPKGRCKYVCTIIYDNEYYAVRDFYDSGIVYIDHKADKEFSYVMAFKPSDHGQNTVLLTHYSYLWKNVKDAYFSGTLRFDDAKTKMCIFEILGIDLYK